MLSCHHLTHPFLNDPGTSQGDRAPASLMKGSTPIDGRQISDYLNYLSRLAHQINFYDQDLAVSDWAPFFSGDLPFILSGIAGYDLATVNDRIAAYTKMFIKRPTPEGLQLIFLYTWYSAIYPIQQWSVLLQDSGLDLEQTLQTLVKDRLPAPVKSFIMWMNTAVKCFCILPADVGSLLTNSAWGLTADDLTAYNENFSCTLKSRRTQLLALQSSLNGLVNYFTDVIGLISAGASTQVNQNLYGLLQTSGQQDTLPHLAVLYSFLAQFQNVLSDLNNLTQGHLNFFFQQVLQLSPGDTIPDKAYIIFKLQKQVASYSLPAGLSLKDGKDGNQADIFFALDAPITVTQAQATDIRTLFVNSPGVSGQPVYVEGVYMAPDATKADGVTQAFADPATASWPSLGAKVSKYTPPRAQGPVDYPSARLGFILTSKILLMQEGKRQVHIRLACQWGQQCSGDNITADFASAVVDAFQARYVVITQAVIDQASAMGLLPATAQALKDYYLQDPCRRSICDGDPPVYRDSVQVQVNREKESEWSSVYPMQEWEFDIWKSVLVPQRVFNMLFSGDKGWLAPASEDIEMEIIDSANGYFMLHLYAWIGQDQGPVTFYDKAKLGEDFGTTDPLVKVQLNDALKMDASMFSSPGMAKMESWARRYGEDCCLLRPADDCGRQISFYQFFRNVIVLESIPGDDLFDEVSLEELRTRIHISVCGVKNIVVQNDDNVLSAKKPFAPFGVKPIVPDFDVHLPGPPFHGANLIGPNFYVGSTEVFLKKWRRVNINLNWKGRPSHMFNYYRAYMIHSGYWTRKHFPRHQVNLSLLHDGSWSKEVDPVISGNPYSRLNKITNDFNRHFFAKEERQDACDSEADYRYSFDLRPADFGMAGQLEYDPVFAALTSYGNTTMNGFVRLTMENQDFLHKLYTTVMAEQVIARAGGQNTPLPNEPWTPTILNISIDYEATATIDDIGLIQLYPYDGTYRSVDIAGEPTLMASWCDEGNLFVGLSGLVPGDSLHILLQLAEATADTEGGAAAVSWQYLAGNQWQDLRTDFEIIQDGTNGLSTTGIVQFSFPNDISNNNTILPAPLYWIKASVPANTAASSQTMGIITQAALAIFSNNKLLNDQSRPGTVLKAGSLSKLTMPDASVNGVSQPYDSFGGSAPEASGSAYSTRVSEQLRHKGRAIQKWDYERMVLQQFPQVLRAKCINHSYALNSQLYKWDFPMAPGSIILAVLPDTSVLTVANTFQPTVPMSILSDIETWFSTRISPFVQLFARNARYEPVDICLTVTLQPGMSMEFYQTQLQLDIQGFMAPWQNGDTGAFQFARRLYRSDLVEFVESRSYIAYLLQLNMSHEGDRMKEVQPDFIDPLTPRSILIAGRVVVNIPMEKSPDLLWKKRIKNITRHGIRH